MRLLSFRSNQKKFKWKFIFEFYLYLGEISAHGKWVNFMAHILARHSKDQDRFLPHAKLRQRWNFQLISNNDVTWDPLLIIHRPDRQVRANRFFGPWIPGRHQHHFSKNYFNSSYDRYTIYTTVGFLHVAELIAIYRCKLPIRFIWKSSL